MVPRVPQLSLLAKFSVVTLLCVAALGAALALVLRDRIEERAAADARELARDTADYIADNHITPSHVRQGLTEDEANALDTTVQELILRGTVRDAKLFDGNGMLVYSHSAADAEEGRSEDALRAVHGETVARFESGPGEGERLYEVYVPLRFVGSATPSGAFELYMPYDPIAKQISGDTRALLPVLIGGLALLYLLLVPIVARASRALRRHAAESRYLALHDELTGLANRRRLMGELEDATRAARRADTRVALLCLDLDRFKDVNDALGHRHADLLLREVGECLGRVLRHGDLLARLDGDEFALLACDVAGPGEALALADRVAAALHREFVLSDVPVVVEASIGVALYPDHGEDAEELLRAADTAMYAAKEAGTRRELYVEARDKRGPERIARLGKLRRALAEGQIVVHYQPKVDLRSGAVTGTEALARWQHPERGVIGPMDFLPLAEQSGLITSLTSHVLEEALAQSRRWADEGIDLTVAVNVSSRSLLDMTFPDEVKALIERHGVERDRLQLELTERSLIGDLARARDVIGRLHELGVRLSVDDFGTGYSSLSRLVMLPLDELKIDRSFVMDIDSDGPGAAIVRSTIDLGHHLGLEVVAEGVETETTLAELRELGCDAVQGYHLLRPLPADEVGVWLRARAGGRLRA